MIPFQAEYEANHIINWTKNWFQENAPNAIAVLGISGGKDSTITAALLAQALGKDRVSGVLMPDGATQSHIDQKDLCDAEAVVDLLGIPALETNIGGITREIQRAILNGKHPLKGTTIIQKLSEQAEINAPPRIRMTMLYAIAQSISPNNIVVNTCNLSEDMLGYGTKYGDIAGDVGLLLDYTKTEVCEIGRILKNPAIPTALIDKPPADGLTGKSDEDILGFSYELFDHYIRGTGILYPDKETRAKMDARIKASEHKRNTIRIPHPVY